MNTPTNSFPKVDLGHRLSLPQESLDEFFLLDSLDQMLRRARGIVGLLQTFHESNEGANQDALGASTAAAMELKDCQAVLDVIFQIRKTHKISDLTEVKE